MSSRPFNKDVHYVVSAIDIQSVADELGIRITSDDYAKIEHKIKKGIYFAINDVRQQIIAEAVKST